MRALNTMIEKETLLSAAIEKVQQISYEKEITSISVAPAYKMISAALNFSIANIRSLIVKLNVKNEVNYK